MVGYVLLSRSHTGTSGTPWLTNTKSIIRHIYIRRGGGEDLKVYLTLAGQAEWALINSLWASIREQGFLPDKVIIFSTRKNLKGASRNKKRIQSLLEGYEKKAEISIVDVPQDDFVETGRKISEVIKKEKNAGNEVALDITAARKALASPALIAADKFKADHVFYLFIEDVTNADRPYMMIPLLIQHSHDFLEGVRD